MDSSVNVPASLRALLADLIDYAGLFPPAGLPMQEAVENYARYRRSEYAWMLGRFVLPAARLSEFETSMPSNEPSPWRLSVLLGPKFEEDNVAFREFGPRCWKIAEVDCVEVKVTSVADVEKMHRMVGTGTTTYYETPLTAELPKLLDAIKRANGRAKVRTGGITAEALPSSELVADFLVGCAERDLPFKATAGLHHPVRCVKPLTYETNAPTGTMHGFLNLFLAAGSVYLDPSSNRVLLTAVIDAEHPTLEFKDDSASIATSIATNDVSVQKRGRLEAPTEHLRAMRHSFAISFGSCSFEEPLADLRELKLL